MRLWARALVRCPLTDGVLSPASTGGAAAARAFGPGDDTLSSVRLMTLPRVASGSPGVKVGPVPGVGSRLSSCFVEQTLLAGINECDPVDAVRVGDRELVEEITALDRARAP